MVDRIQGNPLYVGVLREYGKDFKRPRSPTFHLEKFLNMGKLRLKTDL